jgi:hypothetical protein
MSTVPFFNPYQWYIIRATNAGVFLGKIEHLENGTAVCNSIRRLYYWSGALDVTQIASSGVSNPGNCKFSVQLTEKDKSTIFGLIEFHPASEAAISSINSVKPWKY